MFHQTTSSTPDLLSEWRWLIGGLPRLIGWASAGDLFYVDEEGRVCRLDTGAGDVEPVANSRTEFNTLLQDQERSDELLLLPVGRAFESAHGQLRGSACLGFTTLPGLGGSYSIENRYVISIAEHASFSGDLHRQIRDLPDGTTVRMKVVP